MSAVEQTKTAFERAKAAHAALVAKLEVAQAAKEIVADRIAEIEAKIPGLETEKARLTKAAALGTADKAESAKLGQVRRELADAQEDLESLREQLAVFGPGGEVMDDIFLPLDAAQKTLSEARQQAVLAAYTHELAALRKIVEQHAPRVLALYREAYPSFFSEESVFKELTRGIVPAEEKRYVEPPTPHALSAWRQDREKAAQAVHDQAWRERREQGVIVTGRGIYHNPEEETAARPKRQGPPMTSGGVTIYPDDDNYGHTYESGPRYGVLSRGVKP